MFAPIIVFAYNRIENFIGCPQARFYPSFGVYIPNQSAVPLSDAGV